MVRYACPCLNVSVLSEPCASTDEQLDSFYQRIQTFLATQANYSSDLNNLIQSNFLIREAFVEHKTFNAEQSSRQQLEWINSHLKIKYPLLCGSHTSNNQLEFKLNKCFICGVLTHVIVNEKCPPLTDSACQENSHITSVHSVSILINAKQMNSVDPLNDVKKCENYSHIYDLIVEDRQVDSFNIQGLVPEINIVSLIEQRRFLNQLEDAFRNHKSTALGREEALKLKFETLVNLVVYGDNQNKSQSNPIAPIQTYNRKVNSPSHCPTNNSKEIKVNRRKYDEAALSSSVFEMEEIDELDDEDSSKYEQDTLSDSNENQDEAELPKFNDSILKKRNSNIGDADLSDMIRPSAKINLIKQISFNQNKDLANKYSCSLPRDIPIMSSRLPSTQGNKNNKIKLGNDQDNNENYYNFNNNESGNKERQQMSHSFKNTSDYLNFTPIAGKYNEVYANDEDDNLFEEEEDEVHNGRQDDEDDTTNMGQAISNLASSIVLKDGRELFGGVPSRRVPINSISKSCFE